MLPAIAYGPLCTHNQNVIGACSKQNAQFDYTCVEDPRQNLAPDHAPRLEKNPSPPCCAEKKRHGTTPRGVAATQLKKKKYFLA